MTCRLSDLLGKYVRVTTDSGTTWIGTLTALLDEPAMVIDQRPEHPFAALGEPVRLVLPQRFQVEELTPEQRIAEAVRDLAKTPEGQAYVDKIVRDVEKRRRAAS